MERDDVDTIQLKVRMRERTRSKIEASARENGVSLSAEIVSRVENSFAEETLLRSLIGDGDGHDFLHALHQAYVRVRYVCDKREVEPAPELYAAADTIARVYFRPQSEWLEDYGQTGNTPEPRPGLIGQEAAYQWLWWHGDPRLDQPASLTMPRDAIRKSQEPRPSDSGPDEDDELPLDLPAGKPKRGRKAKPKAAG